MDAWTMYRIKERALVFEPELLRYLIGYRRGL